MATSLRYKPPCKKRNRKPQRSQLWGFLLPLRTLYNFLPMAIIAYAFLDYNMQNQQPIPLFWDGSYRIGLFFQWVCNLTTFTPYDKTETAQRLKVPPPHLYHTKILGYISSNAHKPDRPHNQRTIHNQQYISEKSVLHSFQTDNHRKRHSHSLPRYNRLYNISLDHHMLENHTSHSRQEPYNVIMSERITV